VDASDAPHGLMPMQATGASNRPISLQPFGQEPFRAVCGVAALADSTGYRLRTAPCIPSRKGTCAASKRHWTGSGCWKQVTGWQRCNNEGRTAWLVYGSNC